MEKFRHVPTLLSSDLRPSSVPSPSVGGPHRQETEMAAGTAHSSGKTRTFPTHKREREPGLRIRIHILRIQIQHFGLIADPDPADF